jgi:hypothetical protein
MDRATARGSVLLHRVLRSLRQPRIVEHQARYRGDQVEDVQPIHVSPG